MKVELIKKDGLFSIKREANQVINKIIPQRKGESNMAYVNRAFAEFDLFIREYNESLHPKEEVIKTVIL